MKNLIYGSLIVICVLVGSLVLLLYYTQDFSADFSFEDSLNISKDFQSSYSLESIDSIKTDIGTLELKNKGYFSEDYFLPNIIGCLNLISNSTLRLNEKNFYITINGLNYNYYNPIKVPVNSEQKYNLIAEYRPSYGSVSFDELRENVLTISLYSFETKNRNPFGDYSYDPGYKDCSRLTIEEKPIKTIVLLK